MVSANTRHIPRQVICLIVQQMRQPHDISSLSCVSRFRIIRLSNKVQCFDFKIYVCFWWIFFLRDPRHDLCCFPGANVARGGFEETVGDAARGERKSSLSGASKHNLDSQIFWVEMGYGRYWMFGIRKCTTLGLYRWALNMWQETRAKQHVNV